MFGKKTAAIALSLLLLLPAAALAADEAAETQGNVQELERVEVTGSRLAEELGDVPAPAYVVTSADIAKSGARNVQEILNGVPGVSGLYGSSTMAFDKGVSVRGVNSEVLLLVDGMAAFREAYDYSNLTKWFTTFVQIATDGRQVGVHVIVTGDRPNAIPTSLGSSIQRRLIHQFPA